MWGLAHLAAAEVLLVLTDVNVSPGARLAGGSALTPKRAGRLKRNPKVAPYFRGVTQ